MQDLYEQGHTSLGNPTFWIVLNSSSYRAPAAGNMNEALENLHWQLHNNLDSMIKAKSNWQANDQILAMYYLQWGQRHNPGVMELYRACYRDAPQELFTHVIELAG